MSEKEGPLWGLYILLALCGLFIGATVWYFMPHEGEIVIQTGDSFGPYLYKGKISGGIASVNTYIIEYNDKEFYYRSHETVSLDKEHQYKIRTPDGPGLIIRRLTNKEDET